jgi:hypothetical protein
MEACRRSVAVSEEADPRLPSFRSFRFTLCFATLAMLILSWPLWVEPSEFPRVPFAPALPTLSRPVSWLFFGSLLLAIACSGFGIAWRGMLSSSIALLVFLILQDQHRFQPWAYQFGMTALALVTLPQARALGLARLFIVALYIHSGLSKLDVSFCRELGNTFLEAAVRPMGLVPAHWPAPWRVAAILAMPVAEIAIGSGLCFRKTRRSALGGALALHGALIVILGPWSLNHSPIVLVWNAAMMVEDVLLFGSDDPAESVERGPESGWGRLTRAAFLMAVVLPFGERRGLWDTWPSFALYSSHAERTDVLVHEEDAGALPERLRRHVGTQGQGPWRRLDLTGWSRSVRGVPVYPQGRACLGVAEALAARYPGTHSVVTIQWGRAGWLTGGRSRVESWGRQAIGRQGDRYRINAHPAPWLTSPRPEAGPTRPRAGLGPQNAGGIAVAESPVTPERSEEDAWE